MSQPHDDLSVPVLAERMQTFTHALEDMRTQMHANAQAAQERQQVFGDMLKELARLVERQNAHGETLDRFAAMLESNQQRMEASLADIRMRAERTSVQHDKDMRSLIRDVSSWREGVGDQHSSLATRLAAWRGAAMTISVMWMVVGGFVIWSGEHILTTVLENSRDLDTLTQLVHMLHHLPH